MTFEEFILADGFRPTPQQHAFIRAYDEAAARDKSLLFSGANRSGKTELLRYLEDYWRLRVLAGRR